MRNPIFIKGIYPNGIFLPFHQSANSLFSECIAHDQATMVQMVCIISPEDVVPLRAFAFSRDDEIQVADTMGGKVSGSRLASIAFSEYPQSRYTGRTDQFSPSAEASSSQRV